MPSILSHRSRLPLAVAIILFCLVGLAYEGGTEPHPQFDDAYISFRYAQNLVEGHGLVFNPGERVEGMTNLLWTLLVAAGLAFGWSAEAFSHWLSMASNVALLLATAWYATTALPSPLPWHFALAPALVFGSMAFPVWAFSGLETNFFAALVTTALALDARRRYGAATVVVALATLTRPEGILLAATLFGTHLAGAAFAAARTRVWPASVGPIARCIFGYTAFLALLTAFRLNYYGAPVPNTFYAKVGGVPWLLGARYLHDFLLSGPLPLFIPIAYSAVRDPACRPGLVWAAGCSVYIVAIGGDAFAGHRFWMPVLPVLAVAAVRSLSISQARSDGQRQFLLFLTCVLASLIWSTISPVAALVATAAVVLAILAGWIGRPARFAMAAGLVVVSSLGVAFLRFSPPAFMRYMMLPQYRRILSSWLPRKEDLAEKMRTRRFLSSATRNSTAAVLRRHREEPIHLVAAVAVGRLAYDSRLPVLDLVGLTDATIARNEAHAGTRGFVLPGHSRSDADYVLLTRRPDVIIIPKPGKASTPLPVYHDLWEHPYFRTLYEWNRELEAYELRSRLQ